MDRHRHDWRVAWFFIFLMIAPAIPILFGGFLMIADAIVATAATDDGPVIPQPENDHAGCLRAEKFILPTPTPLQCYLHSLNLALHADVFMVGGVYAKPCGPAYDHIKNKILLPKIRPLLFRLPHYR